MSTHFKPYYVVIFTSLKNDNDFGYTEMAEKMEQLAKEQPGFIDLESARSEIGITVSYWESIEAIANWKKNSEHLIAQDKGKSIWYKWYDVKICKVEREYSSNKL
ncbi:MAG: antibiotic biosynthesis monooxygenase [Flavobacteriaceae bacterium]|nr:antibiotic biosynthesis monooxygenase [Flavobacteriaceae bacterium]